MMSDRFFAFLVFAFLECLWAFPGLWPAGRLFEVFFAGALPSTGRAIALGATQSPAQRARAAATALTAFTFPDTGSHYRSFREAVKLEDQPYQAFMLIRHITSFSVFSSELSALSEPPPQLITHH